MDVKVEKYDPVTTITPWVSILESYLSCVRETTRLVDDGYGNMKPIPTNVREYLYGLTEKNGTYIGVIFPGVTDMAIKALESHGHTVYREDKQSPVPKPDLSRMNLKKPRSGQLEALSLMCSTRHAIIQAPGGWGKSTLIEQFCRIYPQQKFLIVTQQHSVRNQLYERISDVDDKHKVQLVSPQKKLSSNTDIFVLSDQSLHRIPDGWGNILIYDEAHNAGSENTCKALNRFTGLRTYGLSATPTGRQDGTDLQTKAILGPIKMVVPYQAAVKDRSVVQLDVDVYPINMNDFGINSKNMKSLICVVRNTARNRTVAHVTKSVVPPDEQVLILVNTTEHVLRLRQFIPEAVPIYRKISDDRYKWFKKQDLIDSGTPQKVDVSSVKDKFLNGDIRVVISTPIWKEGVDFPNLKYLVKADGEGSPISSVQVACRLSRITEGKERGKLITFIDKYDGMYGRAYKQVKEYRKHGWNVSYKQKLPKEKQW